jgi:hypothetical protein
VWDDIGASNAEFAEAARIFSLKDVTFLEVRFLNPYRILTLALALALLL